jgi:hypothetical protein
MALDRKVLKGWCRCAVLRTTRGDDVVLCKKGKGKDTPPTLQFIGIEKGQICYATDFYSTGHSSMEASVDLEKMRECSNREYNFVN